VLSSVLWGDQLGNAAGSGVEVAAGGKAACTLHSFVQQLLSFQDVAATYLPFLMCEIQGCSSGLHLVLLYCTILHAVRVLGLCSSPSST
jgi:hypothetical protein